MRSLIAGLVLAWLSIACAQADTKTVTWTNPTTNTNGSALSASSITRTTVYWGSSASAMTSSKIVAGAATSTTVDLAPGTWYVGAKTTANGNDSALSNVVQVVIPQPTPNPPVVAVAEVVAGVSETPAYKLTWTGSRGSAVVGFVPKGTACIGPQLLTYRGLGYRKVPASSVKWWATKATDDVVAACS